LGEKYQIKVAEVRRPQPIQKAGDIKPNMGRKVSSITSMVVVRTA